MIRVMVAADPSVCNDDSMSWPVSAARMATSMTLRVRISPNMITSGFSRSADAKASS